ncbi:MAG: aldo/keto reductase [Fusobacteriaceae bacterium]|jgi:predicted aldo/keto reductase-like oxidoreductase|nr:aldo/keto reductase [Fusobacteriaceae bacterium]
MDYLGKNIPKLGFGVMRPPMIGKDVDIQQLKTMTDEFLAAGFSYFDTAWGYLDGKSEEALKTVLVERHPRERFQLATKMPAFMAKSAEEARAMLQTSLARTGAGYFDFYLLHNLGGVRSAKFEEYGIWDYVFEQKAKGILKHVGFSFHDNADTLDEILQKHPEAEFVQLQINWADWDSEAVQSRKCYETARKHGKPVVIMEPVKGGMLASPPAPVEEILKRADAGATFPSWALRFAGSLQGLVTVLSGMSDIGQMEENVETFKNFRSLTDAERKVLEEAQKALAAIPTIPCTACRYCQKDCPSGVAIPEIFQQMNNHELFYKGNRKKARASYFWVRHGLHGEASKCVECGQCEAVCPQHIPVMAKLKEAVALFEKD